MDIQQLGQEGVDWTGVVQGRNKWWDLAHTEMNLAVT